jgi:SM-20-related protein
VTGGEVAALGADGWFSRDDFAGADQTAVAAQACVDAQQFTPAGISRAHLANLSVRGDSSLWLTAEHVAFAGVSAMFEALRCELNHDAWLGLTRFELQLAYYAGGGAAYARHRDALTGAAGRRLTAIAYLNPHWTTAHGGELRLHCEPSVDVAPILGRLVVFMSARLEHEVLPSWAPRLAATAWYYGA